MIALTVLAGPLLASLALAVGSWRRSATQWMLQQHVLVHAPSLPVPGLGGVGLDLPRILILAGILGLVLAAGISALRRRWAEEAAGGRRPLR